MKQILFSKPIVLFVLIFFLLPTYIISQNTANCPNADFSMGDFTNWTRQGGTSNGNGNAVWGGGLGVANVVTPGVDPNTLGGLQRVPPGYTNAAVINLVNAGLSASRVSYTMNVTPANALFIFNYAVVFGDPGHGAAQQPWFSIVVRDANGNEIPCTRFVETIGPGSVGYQNGIGVSGGVARWRDWTKVGVSLVSYISTTVTIELAAGHCSAGAADHWGYAYIVAECQPMEIDVQYCQGDTFAVLTAPSGFESYQWTTGESTQSIVIQNPNPANPNYGVTLTSNNGQCTANLTVNVSPINITAVFDTLTLCNLGASFADLSQINRGTIDEWSWNFGDGASDTSQNPTHYYANPGMYNVELIVASASGCRDTIQQRVYVKPNPIADFNYTAAPLSITDSTIFCNNIFQFNDLSTHIAPYDDSLSVVTWQWTFNGASPSAVSNPNFSFLTEGNHTINLIVTDNRGCMDTISRNVITNNPPIADFVVPPVCGLVANFTDASYDSTLGGTITNRYWNFDDGNTSTQTDPTHTYAAQNTYNVELIVVDNSGCTDTIVKPYRNNEYPVADFILPLNCGLTQTFIDSSSDPVGEPLAWYWNFVDTIIGNALTQQNPSFTFPSQDTFMVRLIVVDTAGCSDTIVKPYQSKESPVANFTFVNVCFGDTMTFLDSSTTNFATINAWSWNFGDGNVANIQNPTNLYNEDGNYNVQLIVRTDLGCEDTVTKPVLIYPLPVPLFSASAVCYRKLTNFTNQSTVSMGNIVSYLWNFGSTLTPSNVINPSVVYPSDGTFNVQLIATSNFGCVDSVTAPVVVHPIPDVDFTAGPLIGCYPFNVEFVNNTTINLGNVVAYSWTLGDGNTSTASNLSHMYPNVDALYTVSLYAISDRGCDTLITKNNYIRVWHKPTADFSYSPAQPNISDPTVDFTNLSVAADSYQWSFDNGTGSATTFETSYVFPSDTGWYDAELIAMTVNGCSDTVTKMIHIGPDFIIYVPNTFTPNGDKRNDSFKIKGHGINNSTLTIFNRWGESLITLSNNQALEIGWDGTYNGSIVQQDTYVYKLEIEDVFGKMHTFHGHINVLK